jgi:hypothetical protein
MGDNYMPAQNVSVSELVGERKRLYDNFNNREVDDEKIDLPEFERITAIESKIVEATFETLASQQVGKKILLDNDETPYDWDCFKSDLFMRISQFV